MDKTSARIVVERVENDTEAGGERKWRQCSKTLQEWRQNVQKPFRHLYVPSSGDLLNLVDVFNVLPAMVRANELDLGAAASWWDDMADDASKAARDKFMAVLATRISSMARQGAEKAAPVQGAAGRAPSASELAAALQSRQFFVYCGHGGGEQYIPGTLTSRQALDFTPCAGCMERGARGGGGAHHRRLAPPDHTNTHTRSPTLHPPTQPASCAGWTAVPARC